MADRLSHYSLRQQTDMVIDQDHKYAHRHVEAWAKTGDMCSTVATSLRAAAIMITQEWPPERSQAARAFSDRLLRLANAFEDAGTKSRINQPRLAQLQKDNVTYRSDIVGLEKRYKATHSLVLDRITASNPPQIAAGSSEDDLLAYTNMPERKATLDSTVGAVPNNWRYVFELQANQRAAQYESTISQFKGSFEPPVPVEPTLPNTNSGGGGTGYSPYDTGGFLQSIGMETGSYQTPPITAPDYTPDDPILDGGYGDGSGGGYPGGVGTPERIPTSGSIPWVPTAAGGYAMAPGGVIGDPRGATVPGAAGVRGAGGMVPMGGAGGARPGAAGTGKSGYVAPAGGMIGGRPGAGGPPGPGTAGRGLRRHPDDDDAFVVPSGVPGVLTPSEDPDDHQPGPGVIGIDR